MPVPLRQLDLHIAHSCNLACQQCTNWSNVDARGVVPFEEVTANLEAWRGRLDVKHFLILGGEPMLSPHLIETLALVREHHPRAQLDVITNGLLLHRYPDLPRYLIQYNARVVISEHGPDPEYLEHWNKVLEWVHRWLAEYGRPFRRRLNLRGTYKHWQRRYEVIDGKPKPYASDPATAYRACCQKYCCQLHEGALWKCPTVAYFRHAEEKLRMRDDPAWMLHRHYHPIPPTATDEELIRWIETKEIPQCALCPDRIIPFQHPSPLLRVLG